MALLAFILAFTLAAPAFAQDEDLIVQPLPGFKVEKMVGGLTYPTALTWDDQGRMYVAESGGSFQEEPPPARILRVENSSTTEVANLSEMEVGASVVGLYWHDGAFYFTHRDARDRTGAVSRMTMDGERTQLFSGIIDSQSEHQVNDIRMGPDGRMYVASGPAGNAAVMGIDNGPNIARSPQVHTTPCQDIVLTGQNFETPDIRTPNNQSDKALTGAYVPFGTTTQPGQRIEGTNKCGGAILSFDPEDPEGTLEPYAHGLRNVIGMAWDKDGQMYVAVNGYDVRGSRPVQDEFDPTYKIEEGAWYGWPDFSAGLDPLTEARFDVPDPLQVPVFVGKERQPKPIRINPVIDHEASGLSVADKSTVFGRHTFGSSPSLLDVAPDSWGEMAGHLFVAEWGDLSPPTNPLREMRVGYQVSMINPDTGEAVPFVRNVKPGPASMQGAMGKGIERPFDVKFGPDGAMYIVDYGVANINLARIKQNKLPYEFPPETGAIWKVTRTSGMPSTGGGGTSVNQGGNLSLLPLAVLGLAAVLPVGLAVCRRRSRQH